MDFRGETEMTAASSIGKASSDIASPMLRQIVFYSLLTSLCPLIPVPLLDDWARDVLRRRLAAQHARALGVVLASGEVKLLACGDRPTSIGGCLRGLLTTLGVKVVRKIFRKIVVVLTVKDCVTTFSETFHEAYLARHALRLGALSGTPPAVLRVRAAIEAAEAEPDHRPVEQLARRALAGS